MLSSSILGLGPVTGAARADAATPASSSTLSVGVARIEPWTPVPSQTKRPLTFTVSLRNNSDTAVSGIDLRLGRGLPISGYDELSAASSEHRLPSDLRPVASRTSPRSIAVPAGGQVQVTLTTSTGIPQDFPLCLCANAVYPLFIAAYDQQNGNLEGFGRTFVSAVDNASDGEGNAFAKVGVAWVWPLIDRPHRTTAGSVFTDDSLRTSVEDGRLARALQVARDVGRTTPLTLVIDPDLIDELAVMTRGYTYDVSSGRTVTGRGGPVAAEWLARLRQVITDEPLVHLQFTPYADPAIQSLNAAGLSWRSQLPVTMRGRVEAALGLTALPSTLSWPPGGQVSGRTVRQIAADGASSVLLDNTSVKPSLVTAGGESLPATSATVSTDDGSLAAGLLDDGMQDDVAGSTARTDASLAQLPHLLAQLSLLADQEPHERRVAFLAAPRYVDPSVRNAETVIKATTRSAFSAPMSVERALAEGRATAARHTRVRHLSDTRAAPWSLTESELDSARRTVAAMPVASSLFGGAKATPAAIVALTQFSRALQRSESAAWSPASSVGTPARGTALARSIRRQVTGLLSGVHIVPPSDGKYSYSLASDTAPLPVTIENNTAYRAFVDIDLMPANGLRGVTSNQKTDQLVAPQSKQTFHLTTHVSRAGRFELSAVLRTSDGRHVLGPRVRLSVHSTVFGAIGLIITIAAAAVLFLALGLRYFRRIQRLQRKRRSAVSAAQVSSPEPVR